MRVEVANKKDAEKYMQLLSQKSSHLEQQEARVKELENSISKFKVDLYDLTARNKDLTFKAEEAAADNEDLLAQLVRYPIYSCIYRKIIINYCSAKSQYGISTLELALSERDLKLCSLTQELIQLKGRYENIQKENQDLVQHQNFKQKLQYHVKIKKENNDLRLENTLLQEELLKFKKKYEPQSLE